MTDQIATVSKERLSSRVSRLSPSDLRQVAAALRGQLGLFDAASPAGAGV
jgi:mRNA-degrading endonuclease toxin of MazEF toxin-antitoxin module